MPTLLVLTSIAFQLFKGLAPPEVDLTNWSLAIPETGQSVFTLPRDLDLSHVQWSLAAREALLASVTAFVPNLLGKLLQFSALEGLFDMDIDYNMEICHAGYSQLVSAPAAMIPTVTYLGMIVAHDMGARSFLPPAMVIGGSTLLVFSGSYIVSLVPKAMFAALLVTSGLNLLSDNLKSAYNDLMRKEFALVVLHIGLTAALGMLSAVVLGMLFTAGIFVVQYSSHSGVLQSATSLLERSKVARTIAEQDILEQYGATVLVIHLHGMIFFGSANSVVEEIKAHLATLAELSLPLRFVLLDFDRCSAIDSSAVNVLFQTRRLTKDAGLIFACAGTDVLAMLNRGKGVSSQGHASSSRPSGTEDSSNERNFEHFTTLDLALEQCENRLLQRYMYEHGGAINPPSPMMLKPHAMFGVAPSWLDHDGHDVHLRTIDERNPMADDRPYTLSNPSSEPDEQRVGRNSAEALPSSAQGPSGAAPAALGADGDGARLLRKHKQRHKRVDRRSASERLPNPFVGSPHHLAVLNASSQKHPQEFRDRPGPLNGSTSSPNHSAEAGMLNGGQPSGDGSDGSSDSSQSGGGVGTIYSPEQARAELRPDHLDKMRDRFTEAMRASYGAKELDELFDHMDIMLIPPNQVRARVCARASERVCVCVCAREPVCVRARARSLVSTPLTSRRVPTSWLTPLMPLPMPLPRHTAHGRAALLHCALADSHRPSVCRAPARRCSHHTLSRRSRTYTSSTAGTFQPMRPSAATSAPMRRLSAAKARMSTLRRGSRATRGTASLSTAPAPSSAWRRL